MGEDLSRKISDICRRVEDLRARWVGDAENAARVLPDALEELQVCLEELSRADEKIVRQNEELILAHEEREKHIREIESRGRFPEENPNPVLRISGEGVVLFANGSSAPLLLHWGCHVGQRLPEHLKDLALHALESREVAEVDALCGNAVYSLAFSPIEGRDYINVYGKDITERKRAEESLRVTKDLLETRVKERTAELENSNLALNEEMSERKAAEKAATAERQRFNDVLETLPAYLVLLTPDYHVPFANRFFRERFGESHGRRCFEYLFGRTEPCEICETYSVLKTMKPHHWEWTGPDERNYDIFDFPFTDTDGSTLIMETGIDITERKQAEIELKKHRERLEELVCERTHELEQANESLRAEVIERRRAEEALQRANEEV